MDNFLQTDQNFPMDTTVHKIFEQCVQRYPNRIAIKYQEKELSFQELNDHSNQLAHFLVSQKVNKQSIIAISMERSVEMIVSILAIIKAGCAYVPIDPNSPIERTNFVLTDTQSPILLTQSHLKNNFDYIQNVKLIEVDTDWNSKNEFSSSNLDLDIKETDLVYCIYTSGSTGKPKGVLVEHRNLVNLISGQQKYFNHPIKNFLFSYSFIFDGSVLLIFVTILEGATLVIAEDGLEKDIHKIAELIQKESISHLLTFPSLYNILLENVNVELLSSLELVSVAGEACPGSLVKLHHDTIPFSKLFNEYGPTEATVGATIFQTSKDHDEIKTPIGSCIDNVRIYLLNENLRKVNLGETGEIHIGGKGVTRGYLNRPELTKEKFIPNPFGEGRLYKTGDLARQLPDGNFDFIGRIDFQVKLRGYRIELGEVESIILQQEKVREVVITLHGTKAEDQKLVAYIVTIKSQKVSANEIRVFLESKLPDYMIPSTYVFLDKLPLSTQGKIDRKALSDPTTDRPNLEEAFVPPNSKVEKFITEKWSKILDINNIGINDKFFELGGNSLQAAKFIADIQQVLKENIFIVSIFENPTVATFTAMLERDYEEAVQTYFGEKGKLKNNTTTNVLSQIDFDKFQSLFPKHKKSIPNKTKNPSAIFIIAPPRSGTTLLRIMLAGHPDIFAANELQLLHFDNLAERAKAYEGKFSLWKEGTIRALMDLKNIDADEAKSLMQIEEENENSTQHFYRLLQELSNGKVLVDKSPSYILDPNALQRAKDIFENARFIHLYRHPYSMIKSFEKMHMDQVMYLDEHNYSARQLGELIWHQSHHNAIQFLKGIPCERQFNISYEDLVSDPEKVMKNLCSQFDLTFHPQIIHPYQDIDKKMTDGIYKDSKPMGDIKLLEHGKIKASLADKWKGVLEDNFLHKKTWDLAQQLNYSSIEKTREQKVPVSNDIAIIGMSARFAGTKDIQGFWDNIVNAKDVSSTFSKEELLASGIDPQLINNPDYVPRGMYLDDADCFDAEFFGYLPKEAALMDPQHRIFLECAYAALEDAGYDPGRTDLDIGVFGGIARNTYLINNVITHPNYFKSIDVFQLGITLEKDFPSTRVAYKLDLHGPAVNVQTACSTSGVAVHLACQSIKTGDADMVIVGGGRIQPPIASGHLHKEGHALSPDGYCRTFDADANGMVHGHGMAFIVLKSLEKAIADSDNIHAVIKGTAINNDGADKVGFTAPSIQGQSKAIIKAYKNAGINPESISYIEAHGTGTSIGDPIEIASLTKAFKSFTDKKNFCHIGSVKANIGHLDAGASIAGIIKTILAMKHEMLPPLMHFNNPNPQIEFKNSPFLINKKRLEWKRGSKLRRAGISSFGLGGTNAHIVLEEAPLVEKIMDEKSHELILLSAKKTEALDQIKDQYTTFFEQSKEPLSSIASTLQMGKKQFSHRAFFIAKDNLDATDILKNKQNVKLFSKENKKKSAGIVFMFPGGGSQHSYMGFNLFKEERIFADAVLECLEILKEDHQLHLFNILYPETTRQKSEALLDPLHGITLLFTIEYATAKLWQSWGIQPIALIGHSLGEYTAACISGVFSLRDALKLVAQRGKLFLTLEEGAMLSVPLSEIAIQNYLNENLSIAAINRPNNCVLSGNAKAIEKIQKDLEVKDIESSRLHISVAAHSLMIEPILEQFEKCLNEIKFSAPKIPIISNVTGNFADEKAIQSSAYWLKHLRQTVRFNEGLETLLKCNHSVFLEIGPGQTLSTFARQHPAKKQDQFVLASLRHPKEPTHDYAFILKTIGQLWLMGINIQWKNLHHKLKLQKVSLPTYPFKRTRHWISPKNQYTLETNPTMKHREQMNPIGKQITRKELILEQLKEIFHQLSGINKKELDEQATFLELGFDSLFLTQAVVKIKKHFGVKISFRQLFEEAPNFNALTDLLDNQLPEAAFKEELDKLNTVSNIIIPDNRQNRNPVNPANFSIQNQTINPTSQDGVLQSIVQQQLNLMQQQLNLLSGKNIAIQNVENHNKEKVNTEIQSVSIDFNKITVKDKANISVSSSDKKNINEKSGKGFGPWKPVNKKNESGLNPKQEKALANLIERYTSRTKGSQTLTQKQRKHLSDPRSITGFNRLWKNMVYQIAVERSKGSKLWDVDGNEYIDYRNAFGIGLFGHSPDFVKEAVSEQLEKGFELGVLTPLANKVADLLCELSGCERATLVNTGSEALVAAVRVARTVTMKEKVVVFKGDYHGIADEMLVRAVKINGRNKAMPVAPGIPNSAVQHMIILDYDDPKVLEKIKAHAHEVAAVLIEPIQPNNPTRQLKELFHQIRQLTLENDIALIFDEMITGFRLAPRGAQEWFDIDVDIIAYGKIISGGLPMAAVAGKAKYMDAFDGGQWQYGDDSYPEVGVTFFGGTFVKHPLCLASAYAALSEIKKRGSSVYKELNRRSAHFAEQLKNLFLKTKVPLRVHATASIVAIQVTDKNPLSRLIFYYLRLKGIHIKEKAAILSTEHTEEDLNFTVKMFEESIMEMQTAGFFKITVIEVEDQNLIVLPPPVQNLSTAGSTSFDKKKIELSSGQKEVWVEQQLGSGAAAAYNLGSEFRFVGEFEIKSLEISFQKLIQRHEALRAEFSSTETVQYILANRTIEIPFTDISDLSPEEKNQYLEKVRFGEGENAIDIFNAIPFRTKLIKVSEEEHYFYFTTHHIIADGWSMGILINDLSKFYTNESKGLSLVLPEVYQISDFIKDQEASKEEEEISVAIAYWSNQFNNGIPNLEFPTDRSRPKLKTYNANLKKQSISKDLFSALKATASQEKTTFFNLMYSAFQVFIHRLSYQEDFVLGITSAAQATCENPHLVTHGVNLLPIRLQTNPTNSFSKTLGETRDKVLDAFEHQGLAFGNLVKQLKVARDPSRMPIISFMFNMDAPIESLVFGDLKVEMNPIQRNYETFDVFINVKPFAENMEIEWIYNTDLFDEETIERRLNEFVTLLESIVENPKEKIEQLNILPDAEKQILLHDWNATTVKRPEGLIHQYLEKQAFNSPNTNAVSDAKTRLTYQELNENANQLAYYLISKKVEIGDFVGIYFERNVKMITALLACIKVGAIYVPLDPINPADRLSVIIEDANANLLITQEKLLGTISNNFENVICIDKEAAIIRECPKSNPSIKIDSKQLVYVNYTSGSTGKPKGVLIPHYAVIDHHLAIINALNLTKDERIFSVASIAFDPSVQDFFMPLMLGASLYIADELEKTDGFQLKESINNIQPTLMQATPSTWRMLLMATWEGSKSLTILCGGEGLTKDLSNKLIARSNRLYNIYGPTETTIWSSLKLLDGDRSLTKMESSYEPIGKPLENVQFYLLDKNQQAVPIGAHGEIYIGGLGVAPNGYFKREELNEEKFINNTFSNSSKDKLYRTGDIARYLNTGDLEYLRRADTQVKIRGFRIELGEIESAINDFEGIQENVVIIREDQIDNKRLVAYCVPKANVVLDLNAIKKYLKLKLPNYMVPLAFVKMDKLPLNANMKINRSKLPAPEVQELNGTNGQDKFMEAKSKNEKLLHDIWSPLLGIPKISMDDDFFELGGHSLIAVNMIALIEKETTKKIPLASLLENSTIEKLARFLEDDKKIKTTANSSLVPIRSEGNKIPLYLVHGAGLHVLMFQTLAANMCPEQPIFALQAKGLNGEGEPISRLEDIASHYIHEIENQNPNGPYALAGYSFGGLIAFEMAKQLKAKGKEVKMLAMFDTIVHQNITGQDAQNTYYKRLANLGKKVAWNISLLAKNPIPNIKYKSHVIKRRYQRWLGLKEKKPIKESNIIYGGKVDQANQTAFANYRISPYSGKIHLFKATSQRFYLEDFEFLGWKPFALGGVEKHSVGGDHLTLFDPPHGKAFARKLQKCLDEIESSQKI